MSEGNDSYINKDVCNEKHKFVDNKFIELKANIRTSKESLSSRLDEVDIALLGNRRFPGGLLRDFLEIQRDLEEHKTEIEESISRHEKQIEKDFKHHKETVSNNVKFLSKAVWITMGLAVMSLGGKFFGISVDMVKDIFSNETIPIVDTVEYVPEKTRNIISNYVDVNDLENSSSFYNYEIKNNYDSIGENK
ncbi:MAG: hypothetical protein KAH05_06975 [Clostridiales bacterium]|nr:hypothetical protein [Clostridiales bacterium]